MTRRSLQNSYVLPVLTLAAALLTMPLSAQQGDPEADSAVTRATETAEVDDEGQQSGPATRGEANSACRPRVCHPFIVTSGHW
jgi:hypothetical protein